jgi:4-amino-4-deoxy-L-arabinose transferase-like glycosyltransferase
MTNRQAPDSQKWTIVSNNLLALIIVVVLTLSAAFSVVLRPRDRLPEYPLTEDGFFSLTVARNIALGKSITSDGEQLTNGFQPLFTFLTVPVFFLTGGDRYSSLRGLLILHWLLFVGTGYILAAIVKDLLPHDRSDARSDVFWITFCLYVGGIVPFTQHFNGLETGASLFLCAGLWRYYQLYDTDRLIGAFGLGLILGLAVLARIDALILVIAVIGGRFFLTDRVGLSKLWVGSIVTAAVAFVVSAPWWLYNVVYFGDLLPTSARITKCGAFSMGRVYWALQAALRYLFPFHPTPLAGFGDSLRILSLITCVILIIHYLKVDRRTRFDAPMKRGPQFAVLFTLYAALLVGAYAVYSCATYFYGRYFAPLVLLFTFGIGYILIHLEDRSRRIAAWISIASGACLICYIILIHMDKIPSEVGESIMFRRQVKLVMEHVPDNEYVAAGQSGTLGYFRDKVVNLDGKLNYEAFKLRNVENGLSDYLRKRDIRWYCDQHPGPIGDNYAERGWELVATTGDVSLYHYSPK